jgi:spermidine synthase
MDLSDAFASRSKFLKALPYGLFFFSGLCGLIYEVIWNRMLVLIMGNTTLATSTILASFMAGLGLGSYFWGRFIDTGRVRPLLVFAALEMGVGFFGLIFPFLTRFVQPIEYWIAGTTGWSYFPQIMIRFSFCFSLLVLPTFLMGGTFAVLGRQVVRRPREFGSDAALLYGINTAGAVLGAYLAGFYLVGHFGHQRSTTMTAGVNLLLAALALLADKSVTLTPPLDEQKSVSSRPGDSLNPATLFSVLAATAISGFCALACQVLWTRLLILVADNSVYSFTVILMAFLTGLSIGSLALAPFLAHLKRPVMLFALIQVGIGLSTLAFPFFLRLGKSPGDWPYWQFLLLRIPWVVLVPTILMGAALPLCAQIYHSAHGRVGTSLGTVLAVNTAGCVLGALTAGFFLIPFVGFQNSVLGLCLLSVLTGAAILLTRLRHEPAKTIPALAVSVVLAGIFVIFFPTHFFSQKYARLEPESRLVYYNEGLAATTTIFQRPDGNRVLYINGIPELDTTFLTVKTLKLLGALPALLHPQPQRALMVTFGAGITAGSIANFVQQVDCVDLADQIEDIARHFDRANDDMPRKKNLSLFIDDARHYLSVTDQRYGIIVSDATHPRSYDSWVLFTREFYSLVSDRLAPGGIFCQWLPLHGISPNQYLRIIKTFHSIFPHTSIWRISQAYAIVVGTPQTLRISFDSLFAKLQVPAVRDDLKKVGLDNPFEILSQFAMNEGNVEALLETTGAVLSDNSPGHLFFPFKASLDQQYQEWPARNFDLIEAHRESIIPYLDLGDRVKGQESKIIDRMRAYEQKEQHP